jgi:hypothetical protein
MPSLRSAFHTRKATINLYEFARKEPKNRVSKLPFERLRFL